MAKHSLNKASVCLVCLKRFEVEKGVSGHEEGKFKTRLLKSFRSVMPFAGADTLGGLEKDGNSTKKDIYIRFMTFVSRYFKLGATTEGFLRNARESCDDEEKVRNKAFCEGCLEVISYICDVYEELQVVKLHLIWKVEKLGEAMIMGSKKGGASAKKTGDSMKALAGQLNLKKTKDLENFRKILRLKCKATQKEAAPKVVVPRGLFPEEWKYTYHIARQTLQRLIVVFILASSALHTKESRFAISEEEEAGGESERKMNLRARKSVKRKMPATTHDQSEQFTQDGVKIKKEDDNMEHDVVDDGDIEDDGPGDDGCDTEWMNDVPSPVASVGSAGDSDASFKTGNVKHRRKRRINLRGARAKRCRLVKEKASTSPSTRRLLEEKGNESGTLRTRECHLCNKSFKGNGGLTHHMSLIHPNIGRYFCSLCKTNFKTYVDLFDHAHEVHKNGLANFTKNRFRSKCKKLKTISHYQCEQCSEKFRRKLLYDEHRKSKHPLTYSSGIDECPVCLKTYRVEDQLVLHIQNVHTKCFPCDNCDKLFGSKQAASEHLEIAHYNSIPCPICGIEFVTSSESLQIHLEQRHETEEKNYFCAFCSCAFTNYQLLETHMKHRHFGQGNKIYCDHDQCSEDFQTLLELHQHLITHLENNTVPYQATDVAEENENAHSSTEDKILKCEICSWSFLNKHNLTLHKLLHIPMEEGAGYKCPECHNFQRTQLGLISHWNLVHENGQRPYRCSICRVRFHNSFIFKMHLRIHHDRSSGRKFVCDICDMEFIDSINLHDHRMRHDTSDVLLGTTMPAKKKKRRYKITPRLKMKPRTEEELERVKEAMSNLICEACPIESKFETPVALRTHLRKKHEETIEKEKKTLPCPFCYQKFAFKQTLDFHVLAMHVDKEKYVCDEETCTETLQNQLDLNQHLMQHIEIDDRNEFEDNPAKDPQPRRSISFCKICNWGFLNPGMLELHELCHIEPEDQGATSQNHPFFQCPKCDSKFMSVTKLSGHYNITHGLNLKPFKCQKCPSRFAFKHMLCNHYFAKHNSDYSKKKDKDTKFDCKVCKLQLASKGGLVRHMKLHNPAERILCPECGESLNSTGWKEHLARVHNQGEIHRCPHCIKTFWGKISFENHLKQHESGQLACTVCHKQFRTKFQVQFHMKTHNPDRTPEFVCEECGMAFKTKSGLCYHTASKHPSKELLRYKCIYCPKAYHRFQLFKMHMKTCMKANGISPDDKDALAALTQPPKSLGGRPSQYRN